MSVNFGVSYMNNDFGKIIHICSNRNVLFTELWDRLISLGVDLRVFHYSHKELGLPEKHSEYDKTYVDSFLSFKNWQRLSFFLKEQLIYQDYLQTYSGQEFVLNHAHTLFSDGYLAYRNKLERGVPYVLAVRGTDINYFYKYRFYLRGLGLKILKSASKIIFLSPSFKRQLFNKYIPSKDHDTLSKKTLILPNGINPVFLTNIPKNKALANDRITLLTVGAVNKNKNQEQVCQAIARLAKDNTGYEFVYRIIGKVEDQLYFERLSKYPFVKYSPPQNHENLIISYREADIFILTSHSETFGLVYAEALSQGLPIIYSQNQGFDGQFPEGYVGYHADSSSVDNLVSTIEEVLYKYDQLAENSVRAAQNFNWDIIAGKYADMYRELLN